METINYPVNPLLMTPQEWEEHIKKIAEEEMAQEEREWEKNPEEYKIAAEAERMKRHIVKSGETEKVEAETAIGYALHKVDEYYAKWNADQQTKEWSAINAARQVLQGIASELNKQKHNTTVEHNKEWVGVEKLTKGTIWSYTKSGKLYETGMTLNNKNAAGIRIEMWVEGIGLLGIEARKNLSDAKIVIGLRDEQNARVVVVQPRAEEINKLIGETIAGVALYDEILSDEGAEVLNGTIDNLQELHDNYLKKAA